MVIVRRVYKVLFIPLIFLVTSCVSDNGSQRSITNKCVVKYTQLIVSHGVTLDCARITGKDIDSANLGRYVKIAMKEMIKSKISKLPLSCFTFEEDEKIVNGKKSITVREIHNKRCGGDPRTASRLLSFYIDIKTLNIKNDRLWMMGESEDPEN